MKSCFAIIKGEEIILHFKSKSLDHEILVKISQVYIYECYVGMVQHKEILYMLRSQNSIMITASLFIIKIVRTWQLKIL